MPWFVGLIFLGIGFILVLKTQWFYDFLGPIDWAEQHMGGTRFFLKLLGVVLIVGTFLGWTGILGSLFQGIFSPVVGNV